MQTRLEELRAELNSAGVRLQQLERDESQTREVVLRLVGAIQVLNELLSDSAPRVVANGDGEAGEVTASELAAQPA
jgi:hypothetical protein